MKNYNPTEFKNINHAEMQLKQSTHEKGVRGEDRASDYLESLGWKIIERNYRCRTGEIDIIALSGETLVFVEVKSLPHGNIEILAKELGRIKQQKILKTAKCYLQKHREYNNKYYRFDVLALDVPGLDAIHHITNAFLE